MSTRKHQFVFDLMDFILKDLGRESHIDIVADCIRMYAVCKGVKPSTLIVRIETGHLPRMKQLFETAGYRHVGFYNNPDSPTTSVYNSLLIEEVEMVASGRPSAEEQIKFGRLFGYVEPMQVSDPALRCKKGVYDFCIKLMFDHSGHYVSLFNQVVTNRISMLKCVEQFEQYQELVDGDFFLEMSFIPTSYDDEALERKGGEILDTLEN